MNRTGIPALEDRINKLQADLQDTEDACTKVEAARDADLAMYDGAVQEAEAQSQALLAERQRYYTVAENLRHRGEVLLARGRALVEAADEKTLLAEEMNLGRERVRAAKQAYRDREAYWAAELGKVQDGKIRRQRAQLRSDIEKLERRVADKAAVAAKAAEALEALGAPKTTPETMPEAGGKGSFGDLVRYPLETLAAIAVHGRKREAGGAR